MGHDIVGRDEELDVLNEFLDPTAAQPRAVVLQGEAGVGKSTLWQAAIDIALRRGLRVLAARPTEAEQHLVLSGLGDLFEGVVDEVLPSLPPARRHAMKAALLLGEPGTSVDTRALAIAVRDTLALIAATGPTVVAIDDVQWLDDSSSNALSFAWRRLDAPVLLVLSRRGDRGDASELERSVPPSQVECLDVGPVTLGALHELLRTRLDRVFARPTLLRIHAISGGNPFYAIEVARALDEHVDPAQPLPVPKTLDGLVSARLDRLPVSTRTGLGLVATAGDPTWRLLIAAGVRRDELEPAIAAQVLEQDDGGKVRFTHPLLASSCYRRLSSKRRQEVHRLLAGLVEDPAARARHLASSTDQPDPEIAVALEQAGDAATARGALAAAIELREQAVRLTPTDDVDALHRRTLSLARAHISQANARRADKLVAELLRREPSGRRRAEALDLAAELAHDEAAIALLRQALSECAEDPALQTRIHQRLGWELRFVGDLAGAAHHAEAALEQAEKLDDVGLRAATLATVASTRYHSGEAGALDLADRAYRLLEDIDDPKLQVEIASTLVTTLVWSGHHDRLRDLFVPFCAEWSERDERLARDALWTLGLVEFVAGRFRLAADLAGRCVELTYLYHDHDEPASLWVVAAVAAHRGDLDEAERVAERGLHVAEQDVPLFVVHFQGLLGLIALWRGNAQRACEHFAAAEQANDAGGSGEPSFARWRSDHAEALLALGRPDEAEAVLDSWETDAVRLGRGPVLATVLRCRGLVAAARGDVADAETLLERAGTALADVGNPFGQARALLALGAVRRRARQKRSAREAIEQSLVIFEECGAEGWTEKARAELGAIGGRRRESELTAAERRVAALAAEGRTNREVAAALFVGERTVETHLSHIYAKLGVRSRTELAVKLVAQS